MRVVKFSSSESCPLYGTMFNIALFTGWLAPGNSSLAPPRPCEMPMSFLSFSLSSNISICHHLLCHLRNHNHPHDHHRSHHDISPRSAWLGDPWMGGGLCKIYKIRKIYPIYRKPGKFTYHDISPRSAW